MSRKAKVMWFMIIGSALGGWVAVLLGAEAISFGSVIGSTLGGIAGIVLATKTG